MYCVASDKPMTGFFPGDFVDYLADRLRLNRQDLPQPGQWSGAGNTIGALALRLDILSLDQIDAILQQQQESRKLFGQVAVDLEFLSPCHVARLVRLQRFHQCLELCEHFVVAGVVELSDLLDIVHRYINEHAEIGAN